jgi:formyl-CoA transferase
MLDFQAARWLMKGEVPKQAGNNHPTSIPTGVFKTSDGYINIATTGDKIWNRFCDAIGGTALKENPDYIKASDRSKNRDRLNEEINGILGEKTSAEWIDILNEAGVPCGPINSIDAVFRDPQVKHLGIAADVKKGDRSFQLVGQPVKLSRTPSRIAAPPPEQGEHTDEVLQEFGFSADEIAALRQANAV